METTSNLNGGLKDSYGGRKVSEGGFFKGMMEYIDDIRKTSNFGTKGRRKAIEDAGKIADDPNYDPNAAPAVDTPDNDADEKKPTTTTSLGFKGRMKG